MMSKMCRRINLKESMTGGVARLIGGYHQSMQCQCSECGMFRFRFSGVVGEYTFQKGRG